MFFAGLNISPGYPDNNCAVARSSIGSTAQWVLGTSLKCFLFIVLIPATSGVVCATYTTSLTGFGSGGPMYPKEKVWVICPDESLNLMYE
ncbi:MAG: hypothetical protein UY62_C0058G0007 [Parcubacteria group bacterium GW2011_GWF2_50_9]|nr:MAG: hypothetical protein UY62_C0058G0007 [Parcubacteria group bacterium GW2011_GWF2_50_9]